MQQMEQRSDKNQEGPKRGIPNCGPSARKKYTTHVHGPWGYHGVDELAMSTKEALASWGYLTSEPIWVDHGMLQLDLLSATLQDCREIPVKIGQTTLPVPARI